MTPSDKSNALAARRLFLRRRSTSPLFAVLFLGLSVAGIAPALRADEILLGPADSFSTDQPRVTIQMEYPVNSNNAFGTPVEMFLDTGASGFPSQKPPTPR